MTSMVIFNPFVPSYRANPYLQLNRLREAEPVHRSEALQAWVLTRYEDCRRVLRDPDGFSSDAVHARGQLAEAIEQQRRDSPLGAVRTVLTSDPPAHTRLRGIVNQAFTPRRVQALRPRIVEIAEGLLDDAAADGSFELMTGLAQPLPVVVIAEMLGVPPEDRGRFKEWSNAIAATTTVIPNEDLVEEAREATEQLVEYFDGFVEARRRERRDDLISALVEAEEGGERLSHEELLAFAILLLVAGNETTTNLIGNGMLALLNHPEQASRLREQPDLVPGAVEEMLRYDSPVQALARFVTREVEFDGQVVAPGETVLLMIGGANRDPRQFDAPEDFDVTREDNRHLSFGQSIHYCLGAPLARVEAEIAFAALLRRFAAWELSEAGVERGGTFLLRGPTGVPLVVT